MLSEPAVQVLGHLSSSLCLQWCQQCKQRLLVYDLQHILIRPAV